MTPLRPGGSAADFDIAWDDGITFTVAEVKSLTRSNENGQLRLGLGQVLHYTMLLGTNGRPTRAVLAVERAPTDQRWIALCEAHGVTLVWPGALAPDRDRQNSAIAAKLHPVTSTRRGHGVTAGRIRSPCGRASADVRSEAATRGRSGELSCPRSSFFGIGTGSGVPRGAPSEVGTSRMTRSPRSRPVWRSRMSCGTASDVRGPWRRRDPPPPRRVRGPVVRRPPRHCDRPPVHRHRHSARRLEDALFGRARALEPVVEEGEVELVAQVRARAPGSRPAATSGVATLRQT